LLKFYLLDVSEKGFSGRRLLKIPNNPSFISGGDTVEAT
jgi:hypothetical protein